MQEIRIKGYAFTVLTPHQQGQRMTEGEAQALNMLRGNNLRDIWVKEVSKATSLLVEGQMLSKEELKDLQDRLTAYDKSYQFKPRHRQRHQNGGDLEVALREVALESIQAQMRHQGLEEDHFTIEEMEQKIKEYTEIERIQEEARRRVQESRRIVVGSLEDL